MSSRTPVMVMAGEFWPGSTGWGLAGGFRSLGWAVQQVDIERYVSPSASHVAHRVVGRLSRGIGARQFQTAVAAAVRALKPDVFLTVKGTFIGGDLIDECRHAGATTAVFYPDVDFDHPGVVLDTFGSYDLLITTKTFHLDLFKGKFSNRVAYVPHGFDGLVHQPLFKSIADDEHTADVLHAGSYSPYKAAWLDGIRQSAPDLTVRIAGARWNGRGTRRDRRGTNCEASLSALLYAEALQTARINCAVHHGPTASGWQDSVSTRSFEIPACRGFMLHIDNEEIRSFYEPGVEIDVFGSVEEFTSKARFYLSRPDLRQAMIERAYRRCVPAYSYAARAREIATLLDQ